MKIKTKTVPLFIAVFLLFVMTLCMTPPVYADNEGNEPLTIINECGEAGNSVTIQNLAGEDVTAVPAGSDIVITFTGGQQLDPTDPNYDDSQGGSGNEKPVYLIITTNADGTELMNEIIGHNQQQVIRVPAGGITIRLSYAVETSVITPDNFTVYFDINEGTAQLKSDVTAEELVLSGDFSGIGVSYITLDKSIRLTGDNALFTDTVFRISADGVTLDGLTITDTNENGTLPCAVGIDNADQVTLSNNTIRYTKADDVYGGAVYAENANGLTLNQNTIIYTGDVNKNHYNYAVKVEGTGSEPASGITVTGNTIEAAIPSVDVSYDQNTWTPIQMSSGLDFKNCGSVDFSGNTVSVTSSGQSGNYPTAYGVLFSAPQTAGISEPQIKIQNNTISITGKTYVYGVNLSAAAYDCSGNTITVTSDMYAYAIQSAAPAEYENIQSNQINVVSDVEAYGFYSILTSSGDHKNVKLGSNVFDLTAPACTCILKDSWTGSVDNCYTIEKNTLEPKGEQVCGISLYHTGAASVIVDNEIITEGTKAENPEENANYNACGIKTNGTSIRGNKITSSGPGILSGGISQIENNRIETVYDYTIDLKGSESTVINNYLKAAELTGDASVCGAEKADVHDNEPADITDADDHNNDPVNITGAAVTGITNKTYTGKAVTQNPVVKIGSKILKSGTDYTITYKNNVNAGKKASVVIQGKGSYTGTITKTFTINKAANPLKIKGRTAAVKYKKLKKKAQTLAVKKLIKFTKKGQGTMKYTLSSAKKGKKSFKQYFKINAKTGKVTVKKKLKKGTYTLKVKVKAAGNANYKASAVKTVSFKIKVR